MRTLIAFLIFVFILSSTFTGDLLADEDETSAKVVLGEIGVGYLFAGGGLIAGTGIGQVVYPKSEEHAGGGLVGALMGFCVGGSVGVYAVGEKFGGDSTNDPLVFFSTVGGGLSVPLIGFFLGIRPLLTYGVLVSPIVSCITYNLVKETEEVVAVDTTMPIFSIHLTF